jgi:hypothetical protein
MRRRSTSVLVLAVAAALAGGCGRGGRDENASAIQRDETRAYGPVSVRSDLAPKRATLGDLVLWTLTATLPEGTEPGALRLDPGDPALEIVPRASATRRAKGATIVWERRFEVRGFGLGSFALPAAALPVRRGSGDEAITDSLLFPPDSLGVDSLTTASTGDLDPDRGPIDPGPRPVDLAVAAGLALVLLAAVVAASALWRKRRRRVEAAPPPIPPETTYLEAIASLERDGADLPRDAFHERLSDAIRRYVGAVAGVDAMDRTTRELEGELRASRRARPEAVAEVGRILRRSDLVKFARREDAWTEARALLDDARRLAGSVAPAPPPSPAPETPPAPAGGPSGRKGPGDAPGDTDAGGWI